MYVYCDESSQTKSRHMVLGALFLSEDVHDDIEQEFREIRGDRLANAEMKWEKVSDYYFDQYRESALLIARRGAIGHFEFHAMMLDRSKFDHETYNQGDEELGYYKFFFNLLKWRMMRHEGSVFYVTMHRRNNKVKGRLDTLKYYLNSHLFTKWSYEPVREIVARAAPEVLFLQITDILIGAIAYHANNRDAAPNAKRAKVRLAREIARGLRVPSLSLETRGYSFYSNWRFRLEEPQRQRRGAG